MTDDSGQYHGREPRRIGLPARGWMAPPRVGWSNSTYISKVLYPVSSGCAPVEIMVSVLGPSLPFPSPD